MRGCSETCVAVVANTAWYLYNFRGALIRQLLDRGWDVVAVAAPDGYVSQLEALGCRFVSVPIEGSGTNPFVELRTVWHLFAAYRRWRPDVILQYTPKPNIYGGIAAQLAGIPCINNVSGLGSVFINGGPLSRVVRGLYRISQRRAYRVFFQNPDDRQLFIDSRLVDPARTALLPGSGVDLVRFAPRESACGDTVRFLLIARLLWEKGIGEYVEAARALKRDGAEAECQLLGFVEDDNPRMASESQVRAWEAEGVVRWLGSCDDVRPHIAQADCVVLPSYYREGTPRSLLEAAAMGKPLITTDAPGCREVVDDGGNGFLCHPRDWQSLYHVMTRMLALTPEQRDIMGRRSREKMEREYDEQIVINAYLEAVEGIACPA